MLFFSGQAETVADSEEGPPPPLFLDQTEARRAEKIKVGKYVCQIDRLYTRLKLRFRKSF